MPADNHDGMEVMADDQMPYLPADAGFDRVGNDLPFFKRDIFDEFVGPFISVGILMDEEFDGGHVNIGLKRCEFPMYRIFCTGMQVTMGKLSGTSDNENIDRIFMTFFLRKRLHLMKTVR